MSAALCAGMWWGPAGHTDYLILGTLNDQVCVFDSSANVLKLVHPSLFLSEMSLLSPIRLATKKELQIFGVITD